MKKLALALFLLASATELTAHLFNWPTVRHFSKPLLMAFLGLYYYLSVEKSELSKLVVLALVFSWGGDVLLMYQPKHELYFIFGLASFLAAHLFYIFTYKQFRSEDTSNALMGVQRFRYSFPVILAGTGLITVLYNHLGDLKIPVVIYALVLVLMVLNALFRFGRTSLSSFSMVFFGATLFMISDSLIAINKFLMPVANSGLWVMITYITAQYLIIEGLLKHKQ
ncbi:lysoplasmalogenase [Chryseotalea sanaruensis]|uniref:Lysoplasmalogenase n=1 Tax=Chryseotalea sanaruensis TaxID=2482724 RepID=A0A401U5M2_9BACT|nr:lysoplasmalogenase [Chryseotalea sanaruensis]GCC50140.1 lysoplasmalogenase [Chryseotalea sanaruensis]